MTEQAETRNSTYYHALVDLAVLAGEIMMSSGAETQRTEDTMIRILSTSGLPRADAFVLSTGLTLTLSYDPSHTITVTRRAASVSNNLGRVYEVNRISRDFCDGRLTLEEATAEMKKARHLHLYNNPLKILGGVLTSGTFSYMFGGTVADAVAAMICGLVLMLTMPMLQARLNRAFVTTAIASLMMALSATTLDFIGNNYLGIELRSQYLIVGAMMPVVPGVAITNAIRDMLQGDYVSACARIMDAFLTAAAVAVGVGLGLSISRELGFPLTGLSFVFAPSDSVGLQLLWEAIAAFIAAYGFCFLLEVPKRLILPSSTAATVCWILYLLGGLMGFASAWSALLASAAVYLFSYVLARRLKAPVSVFLIVAILPLVPGFNIYRTIYCMIIGEGSTAEALAATLLMAGAIALGIFVADLINDLIKKTIKRKKIRHSV
ncbi:MAG: threonine/serine exporter family protein [Clostridia bacterium]|nr:threonine/serine exporter family protein [Clostridia bacterium]